MEYGQIIFNIFLGLFGFLFGMWTKKQEKKSQVIIYKTDHKHGWLDIRDHPIPEGIKYLASDGKCVQSRWTITYNSKGQPITDWEKTLITLWMPMPEP